MLSLRLPFLLLLLAIHQNALTQNANLQVTVTHITPVKGQVKISLFNKGKNFLEAGYEYRIAWVTATAPSVTHTFRNLPHGEYAIGMFHDKNSDGKLNLNWLGLPKEDYGFSNNVRPVLSVPKFRAAKFRVKGNTLITIKLIR